MNSYFNFQIPYFNSKFGSDWGSFNTIVDDNTDYVMAKTYDLYKLKNIEMMPIMALELALGLRKIETTPSESIAVKKLKLRNFSTNFRKKGTSDMYLDYQEAIVGIRGATYNAYSLGQTDWGHSSWAIPGTPDDEDRVWATVEIVFQIYIDCKTTDDTMLDEIVAIYRQNFLLPAFYEIFLVDSDMNILRSV